MGICTCPHGENGTACAHQAAIALRYGGCNLNFMPQSSEERYKLAVLAIGDNPQLNVAKFAQLHEKPDESEKANECADEEVNVPQQNHIKIGKQDEQDPFDQDQKNLKHRVKSSNCTTRSQDFN